MSFKFKAALIACVFASLAAPALATTETDIQARAEVLSAALAASDIPAVRKILAPDFQGLDMNAQALSAETLIAGVHPGGRSVQLQTLVSSVRSTEGVVRAQRITAIPDAASKPGHQSAWIYASDDTWKQINGVWRLQSTRQTWASHFVNREVTEQRHAVLKVALPDADPSLPDISTGNPKAAITVIEYGSVACPICAMVNQDIMPGFFATYVATGKVRFIYRPMQTGNPAVARLGHALAECAGRDKYFSVIDTIMRAQPEMDQGGQPEQYINAPTILARIGRSAGLSPEQVDACFSNEAVLSAVDRRNAAYINRDGVDGTPTFLVNGLRVEGDLRDEHVLDKAIQPLLK